MCKVPVFDRRKSLIIPCRVCHPLRHPPAGPIRRQPTTLLAGSTSKLSQNRDTSPLFDTRRFCRHLEAAYTEMLERQCCGEPPQGFMALTDY
jgi:hypothetical protein